MAAKFSKNPAVLTLSSRCSNPNYLPTVLMRVWLPQVLLVLGAPSGAGLSVPGVPLELLVLARSVAYGCSRAFPFSAWGEVLFLLLQTMTLGFLMQHLRGTREEVNGVCGAPMGAPLVLLGTLLSPHTTPGLITFLQAANLPIIILTSMCDLPFLSSAPPPPQSSLQVRPLHLGPPKSPFPPPAMFHLQQEAEDPLLTLTFATSAACNGLLLGQLLYYGGGGDPKPPPHRKVD
uniref:Solute carrier family 66 member 3 n=1 Tax=Strigops habroptila TaxID=2489341 RepID=A0A672UEC4_STRHB